MPELPEVETTRRGLLPLICGKNISDVRLRIPRLRQALNKAALKSLIGRRITGITRRAKYLLIQLDKDDMALLVHLGMSGSLRVIREAQTPLKKHDHIILTLNDGSELRFHDPRRFGHFAVINPHAPQKLLDHLGPEPLSEAFSSDYLYAKSRRRKVAIKAFIMNQEIVVGVGNIYATEALFLSGIRPGKAAARLSKKDCVRLVDNIKQELTRAITLGGTTLRDFVSPNGTNGYFQQTLKVYGKADAPCPTCGAPLQHKIIGGRMSVYCAHCQQ